MAAVRFNRCKNCRMWEPARRLASNQFRMGTGSRRQNVCNLHLREITKGEGDKAETVLVPSADVDDKQGPRFGEATSAADVCKYFVRKNMPYRRPAILDVPLGAHALEGHDGERLSIDALGDVNLIDVGDVLGNLPEHGR